MGSKLKEFEVPNFAGGYNNFLGKRGIRDNESPDMLNVDFTGWGGVKKRRGYTAIGTSQDSRVRGLGAYVTSAVRRVVRMSATKLRKLSDNSEITGFTFTTNLDTEFVQAMSKLYIMNGTDSLVYYDGATLTEVAANGNIGSFGIYYNQRLYCNNSTYPDRLYFSGSGTNIGDFSSGTPAYGGYLEFRPGSGTQVKGLTKFGNYLYVWLDDSIYRVQPTADTGESNDLEHTVELVTNLYGCTSHRSIDQVENDVFFLSREGVKALGEQPEYLEVRTMDMSTRIQTTIDALSSGAFNRAAGLFFENKYYLGITDTSAAYNDKVLPFDVRYRAWLYWDSINVNCWLDFLDSSGVRHFYFGDDNSGQVYELELGANDAGAAIDSYFYTKSYDLKDFSQSKLFMDMEILFGAMYGITKVDVILNEDEIVKSIEISSGSPSTYLDGFGSLPMGTFRFGLESQTSDSDDTSPTRQNDWIFTRVGYEGESIQLKFSNSTLNEGFEIQKTRVAFIPFTHYKRETSKEIK